MAAEFLNVWVTNDQQTLAWEVGGGEAPKIFVLPADASYADEVQEITDLATGWIHLGPA